MKRLLLILCLITLSMPAFATFGYYEGCNDNVKGYDNSALEAYHRQLEDNFYKKYKNTTAPMGAYDREVISKEFEWMSKHPVQYDN